jgi:biotin carboxylase
MTSLILCTPKVLLQNTPEEWLEATGGDAVLFTGLADAETSKAVEELATRAFRQSEFFHNYEHSELIEPSAIDLHLRTKFSRVLAFSEADVLRAARIRNKLALQGQTPEAAQFFRDKILMKRRAWERGVDVPRFAEITSATDLTEFIAAHGLPVVVKPFDGRGSSGVVVLTTEQDVVSFLENGASSTHRHTVEQFVQGEMFRVDGLYVDGSPVVIHAARYLKDCLAFIRGETIGTHSLDAGNPLIGRIEEFTRYLLEKALPFPATSIFHLQIFLTPDDRLVLCEVASRLGGGVINEEVLLATGVNMKMGYVKASIGGGDTLERRAAADFRPTARIIIPPKHGVLESLPLAAEHDWIDIYKPYGVVGRHYGGASMTNAEVASFVFGGENEEELRSRALDLDSWFNSKTMWAL